MAKIFKMLDDAEDKREEEMAIEEEEIGFKETFRNDDPDTRSVTDSEYSDGELKGNEKQKIFKQIISSLNESEKQSKKNKELKEREKKRKPSVRRTSVCVKRLGMEDEKHRQEVAAKKLLQKKNKLESYPMISSTNAPKQTRQNTNVNSIIKSEEKQPEASKTNAPKFRIKGEEEKKERMAQQNYLNRVGIKNSGQSKIT